MKKCIHEQKYSYGLTRCLRDGSLRYCKSVHCPHFKPTFKYRRWVRSNGIHRV